MCDAFWVPYEVHLKDFSKFHSFPSSSSVFLNPTSGVENSNVKNQPCHTSKVASWLDMYPPNPSQWIMIFKNSLTNVNEHL